MAISNFSGKNSSLEKKLQQSLESGQLLFKKLSALEKETVVRYFAPKIKITAIRLKNRLPAHIDLNELISAGVLGLMEALQHYSAKHKVRLDTYVDSRIRGAMLDELRRMDWFSRGMRRKAKTLESLSLRLEQETGSSPSTQELARLSGLPETEVQQVLNLLQTQIGISLEAVQETLSVADKHNLESQPFSSLARSELIDKIAQLIDELTQRERLVLALYYGEELNMREVAEVLEVTEGRISQLHSQALKKLKKKFISRFGQEATDI